jgi:hypothetical protein
MEKQKKSDMLADKVYPMQIDTDRFIIMITCKPVLELIEIVYLS